MIRYTGKTGQHVVPACMIACNCCNMNYAARSGCPPWWQEAWPETCCHGTNQKDIISDAE